MIYITGNRTNGILFDRGFTDLLRFMACCIVAIGHYAGYAVSTLGIHNMFYDVASAQFGYFGVALFFFLSGYGLMMSIQSRPVAFKEFVTRRLRKTYIPAVLASGIWLVVNLLLFLAGGGHFIM